MKNKLNLPLWISSRVVLWMALLTVPIIFAADKTATSSARFKLVAGQGYTVCEAYLKHLNALPKEEPPPVCEVKLSHKYRNLSLPEWEMLEWRDHLDWIHLMELNLSRQNPADDALRKLTFAEWEKTYLDRVEKGELKPRLRRTKVTLNARGPEVLFAYDQDVNRCEYGQRNYKYASGGSFIFGFVESYPAQFRTIGGHGGTALYTHMLIYQQRPYFVHVEQHNFRWEASMYKVMPPLPPNISEASGDYVMNSLNSNCRYLLNK